MGDDLLGAQRKIFTSGLTSTEKLVLLAVLAHWSRSERTPWPGVARLAEWTSFGRATVLRALGSLESKGVIVVTHRSGCPNRYDLGPLFNGSLPVSQRDRYQSETGITVIPDPSHSDTGPVSQRDRYQSETGITVIPDPSHSDTGPVSQRDPKGSKKGSKKGSSSDPDLKLCTELETNQPTQNPPARAHAREAGGLRPGGSISPIARATDSDSTGTVPIESYRPAPSVVASAKATGKSDQDIADALERMQRNARKRHDTLRAFDGRFRVYLGRLSAAQAAPGSEPRNSEVAPARDGTTGDASPMARWSPEMNARMFGDAYDDIDWENDV